MNHYDAYHVKLEADQALEILNSNAFNFLTGRKLTSGMVVKVFKKGILLRIVRLEAFKYKMLDDVEMWDCSDPYEMSRAPSFREYRIYPDEWVAV